MKVIKARLLKCCGGWINVVLDKKEFKFIKNYARDCNSIQLWEGKNKDIFILKGVKIENGT